MSSVVYYVAGGGGGDPGLRRGRLASSSENKISVQRRMQRVANRNTADLKNFLDSGIAVFPAIFFF
jgi:hypothetical protein